MSGAVCEMLAITSWSDAGGIASVISAVAAIAGLVFISVQVRLGRQANQAQAAALRDQADAAIASAKSRLLELSNPINVLLFENPDLCQYFLFGQEREIPDQGSPLFFKLMMLCEMQANYIEYILKDISYLSQIEQDAWKKFIHDSVNRSMFRRFWSLRGSWYDPKIADFFRP